MVLYVAGLWRYPVKSLAGESVASAGLAARGESPPAFDGRCIPAGGVTPPSNTLGILGRRALPAGRFARLCATADFHHGLLGSAGVPGDRLVRVMGPEGVRTSRCHYRLLGLRGSLDASGRALIDGHPWWSDDALALIRRAAGDDAWLEATGDDVDEIRFDVLPLLVATDGAVAAFGREVRRLRPNILIGGVDGLAERDWPGRSLRIGEAVIRLDSLRARCPMTTVDPDTIERDPEVLRDIGRRFGGRLALNADVERGGVVRVGDWVTLVAGL